MNNKKSSEETMSDYYLSKVSPKKRVSDFNAESKKRRNKQVLSLLIVLVGVVLAIVNSVLTNSFGDNSPADKYIFVLSYGFSALFIFYGAIMFASNSSKEDD